MKPISGHKEIRVIDAVWHYFVRNIIPIWEKLKGNSSEMVNVLMDPDDPFY